LDFSFKFRYVKQVKTDNARAVPGLRHVQLLRYELETVKLKQNISVPATLTLLSRLSTMI